MLEMSYVYATYTGHIFDTTLDIYFCEARFYDAQTRTWLAMDPVKDGGNWYQYCYSNPLRYWDPLGLVPAAARQQDGDDGFTTYGGCEGISYGAKLQDPTAAQVAVFLGESGFWEKLFEAPFIQAAKDTDTFKKNFNDMLQSFSFQVGEAASWSQRILKGIIKNNVKYLENLVAPNGVGMGTWAKSITSQIKKMQNFIGDMDKAFEYLDKAGIVLSILESIDTSLKSNSSGRRMVADVTVDAVFAISELKIVQAGAEWGTALNPGTGTIVGTALSSGFVYLIETYPVNGGTIKDFVKDKVHESLPSNLPIYGW